MEQIYTDFTTKLLPKIQEGLIITKDYFFDLFSRYVKYLIITDSVFLVVGIVGSILVLYFTLKKNGILQWVKDDEDYGMREMIFLLVVPAFIFFFGLFLDNTNNLIKDFTIPEVRVIEKIQAFKNN